MPGVIFGRGTIPHTGGAAAQDAGTPISWHGRENPAAQPSCRDNRRIADDSGFD